MQDRRVYLVQLVSWGLQAMCPSEGLAAVLLACLAVAWQVGKLDHWHRKAECGRTCTLVHCHVQR